MRGFAALALLCLLVACPHASPSASKDLLASIEQRFVVGRGGDVFVAPQQGLDHGQSVLLVPRNVQTERPLEGGIYDVAVAEMSAHALGVAPLRPAQWSHFVKGDMFHKQRASVLLVVDGVGGDVLKLAGPHMHVLGLAAAPLAIRETAAMQDSLALLTTLAAGATPSVHGIGSASWFLSDGTQVNAYSGPASARRAHNLADRVARSFNGQSLVIAVSSDAPAAAALGVHAQVRESSEWNVHARHWNAAAQQYESAYAGRAAAGDAALQVKCSGPKRFAHLVRVLGAVLSERDVVLRVDGLEAHFALQQPAELAFLAELEMVLATVAALQADPELHARATDAVPDVLAFCVASLRSLKVSEDALRVALLAVDRVLEHSIGQLSALYSDRLLWQVAFVDQLRVTQQQQHLVASVAQQLAAANAVAYGVDIFSRAAAPQLLCSKLSAQLAVHALVAVCPIATVAVEQPVIVARGGDFAAAGHRLGARNGTVPPKPGPDDARYDELVQFHMLFWTSLVLFLLLLFGANLIGSLEIPSDSQLLRNLPDIYRNPTGTVTMRELGDE